MAGDRSLSRFTWVFGVVSILASLASWGFAQLEGPLRTLDVVTETAVAAAAAAVTLWAAASYERGQPIRLRWMLIGVGIVLFAAGDAVWAYVDLVLRQDPYPSIADAFFIAMYPFIGAGLILAALGFGRVLDVRGPALATVLVAAGALIAAYHGVIARVLADQELDPLAKFVSVLYPVADIVLMLGPALFCAIIIVRLGTGIVVRPWVLTALGAALVAVADTWMSLYAVLGIETQSSIADLGWPLGFALMGLGALMMRDINVRLGLWPGPSG